jgi:preprotein translocase subunit SecD
MSLFRQRRFGLLLLVVFISVMLVWRPWEGLEPQARGLNFGVDVAGGYRAVLELENSATASTQADVISKLQARIDPYGLLGASFRTLGENCILCETTQLNSRMEELLTKQGGLELFMADGLVLTDNDIKSFGAPTFISSAYSSIHINYTDGGWQTLEAMAGTIGNCAGVVYLDRPSDAILIFDEDMLKEISQSTYDNSTRMFVCSEEGFQYDLLVPAVGTSLENLSPQALDYLENQVGVKQRVILLGGMENFAHVIEKIPENYLVENISRPNGESADEWIKRSCGLISDFPENVGVGDNRIIVGANLRDTRDIYAILSNKLPVELSILPNSETEVKATLSGGFVGAALIAVAVSLAGVSLLIYFRYRRWKICLAIIGITMCEFAITLGATSALGLAIGLPEIGGLLLVIGTGIDHQLIVTDEMLQGGSPQAKSVSVGWRASRALIIVYAAMSVIIAAMIPIALLGFSAIRGFTIIAITGTILALLFTRSFYAKIIDAISAS